MNLAPFKAALSRSHLMVLLAGIGLGGAAQTTLATSSATPPRSTNQIALTSANTGFAFNLLQTLADENPGSNIFISPYSASTALEMVSLGAKGETLSQMQEALQVSGITPSAMQSANKATAAIIDAKNANFTLTTANSIWYKAGMKVNPSFLKENTSAFSAKIEPLNFLNPTAPHTINAWASSATHGEIKSIVSPPFRSDLRMILANAVYFFGTWQTPFDVKQTTTQPFYTEGGGQVSAPMMTRFDSFNYSTANGYQAIELPYKGGDVAMYVFLPGAGTNLQDFAHQMSGSWWEQTVPSTFTSQTGTLSLPKFNLNFSSSLVPALETMGVTNAFVDELADFSGITTTEPLYISEVKQQAIVKVDEKGTTAAAITTVGVRASAEPAPTPPFVMNVDRPFIFFIQDLQTKTVLFSGMVFSPSTAAN